jgi:uncharacterized cupredoxin-like copper-binding protein
MKPSTLTAAFALMLIAAAPGPTHSHEAARDHDGGLAFGEPGDPGKPAREIVLTMKEADGKMVFSPNKISVKKGEQIRFQIRNEGAVDHEIVLATLNANLKHAKEMEKNPDMEHDDPNMKRLAPGKSAEILWKFSKAGTFDFSCLIPGHRQAGMFGTVTVK